MIGNPLVPQLNRLKAAFERQLTVTAVRRERSRSEYAIAAVSADSGLRSAWR